MSFSPSSLRFGPAELRAAERQLLVHGQAVPLGARAWDVLLVLVERRERVVSRKELLDLVWPNVAVEDHNLSVQVAQLRRFLGADAVSTVPGRGYRFTMRAEDGGAEQVNLPTELRSRAGTELPLSAPLFGRDEDLEALLRLITSHRLVTVSGASGVGKTSIALAAARVAAKTFGDGCRWVDLAQIADPALILVAIAQALHLPVGSGNAPLPALLAGLRPLHVLLILDNAEHLLEAVANLAGAVVAGTPGVCLLITSQARLRVEGERLFRLEPLPVAPQGTRVNDAMSYGAVALFVDQAQALDHRFELTDSNVDIVANVCRQLDGIALALKLAAARMPLLGLHGIESRLADRLQLLGGHKHDAPTRQQTLRAALDWTYGLLAPQEQAAFCQLGVFVGGFSLELAATVVRDGTEDEALLIDSMESLVDRSLVVASDAHTPRYRLLESAREYALFELGRKGELHAARRAHAHALLGLFRYADERQWVDQDELILSMVAPELDNLRAALDWGTHNEPQLSVAMLAFASRVFVMLGLSHEHRRRCAALEAQLSSVTDVAIEAKFWLERARTQAWSAYGEMYGFARRAETLYRSLSDAKGIYMSLGYVVSSGLASAEANQRAVEEMASLEHPEWPLRVRMFLRVAALYRADPASALDAAQAALAHARAVGAEQWTAMLELWVVNSELNLGHLDAALMHCEEMLDRERHRPASQLIIPLAFLARILLLQGKLANARAALHEFSNVCRMSEWDGHRDFAGLYVHLAVLEQRYDAAARLVGFADKAWRHLGRLSRFSRQVRDIAHVKLEEHMDTPTRDRLMAEGERMDEEAMVARALAINDAA
ncbi:ATP-binding protein [Piscinibacter terrae]|uniref:OmpR/PhoB-type domain-containing protein n=1 Tax=Piscinibacter terrae TaxID=2496871 RepID=A0A3N7IQY8_9BURK|nr:winged helix-turn-helix domain-containing protein [Albitalea terrae]RQP21302.1 hypothetical protein DZC73_27770 [Albitalea terrae]